jgi:hypothetical protein
MTHVHICRFSAGLDDLTRKQQADHIAVLRVLKRTGRFSIFEATDNPVIARMMTRLTSKSLITVASDGVKTVRGLMVNTDNSCGYPWTKVTLTPAAEQLLSEHPA